MTRFLIFIVAGFQFSKICHLFNFTCPKQSHWNIISSNICKNARNYLCLLEAPQGSYRQECKGPKLMESGFKWIWEPNFNRGECDPERYQPFIFSTDGYTDCAYLKGQCFSEGQITGSNGSNKESRQCHCDISGGYILVNPAFNAGLCLPSVEDCSCYKSSERAINGSQNVHTMKSYGNEQMDLANHVKAYNDPRYNIIHESYKKKTFWYIFALFCSVLITCPLFITFLWEEQSTKKCMPYQSFEQTKMENMASCFSTLLYTKIIPDTLKLDIEEVQTGGSFPDKMSSDINEKLTCISLTKSGRLYEEKIQTKHPSTQTRREICINKTITDTKTTHIYDFDIKTQLVSNGIFEDTYKIFASESLPSSLIPSHVIPLIVSRVDIKHRSIMRNFFLDNERYVFEKDVSNPLQFLETLFQFIQTPGNQGNTSICNMTKVYDQYVAFSAFTVDDLTNKTNDIDPESNLFNDIEAIASKTSYPDVTLCMLYGRKAVAYSFKNKKVEGENMRSQALVCAENIGPCLEKVDMLYKLVLFSRAWYEYNPDEELAFILKYTYQALDILESLSLGDDQQRLWQKRFVVRLLFCYVGIGMRGKFISTYKLKSTHEQEAVTLLNMLNASNSSSRLQMLVNVAKSRVHQLNYEFEEAIFYNKKAKIIAIEKNYCEREEILISAKKLKQHYIENA